MSEASDSKADKDKESYDYFSKMLHLCIDQYKSKYSDLELYPICLKKAN